MSIVFLISMIGTILISFMGLSEYLMYDEKDKQKANILSSLYLFGMLLIGMLGFMGLVMLNFNMSSSAEWSGFSIIFLLISSLVLIQHKMHKKMDLKDSPLRTKLSKDCSEDDREDTILYDR